MSDEVHIRQERTWFRLGTPRWAMIAGSPAAAPPALPDPETTLPPGDDGGGGHWDGGGGPGGGGEDRGRPRVHKLRFLLILCGLGVLAAISTVFGMLMAVASDLPALENTQQYSVGKTSYLYDDHWRPIGIFAGPEHEVIDTFGHISPWMRRAIVSIEDKRFWTNPGVDLRGVARALYADITGGATQGASTITEQFVKNTLHQEGNRTVLEKLREAALAFQLAHKWPKRKILTEYLNSIYFGNGAYGVESAARVYFGRELGYDPNAPADGGTSTCGDSTRGHPLPTCAALLKPWESALLAGMVANPSAFDPIANPVAARARRDLVLQDMLSQHYITRAQYRYGIAQPLPTALEQPQEPTAAPYFTSWLRPQILAAMGMGRGVPQNVAEYRAYYGGLKIRTSLDLEMQEVADQAISEDLPYDGPQSPVASLVAIDNKTGEVRAMVGGPIVNGREDYTQYPFNIATEGERQPGSAFKPFTLAVALESGFGPDSVLLSAPANFVVPNSGGKEIFHVRNFGDTYSGPITLQEATDISDNSVYSRLGIEGLGPSGTRRISRLATAMGIRTPVSTNYAMILGGLKVGVSPLDMAHAYETFATGGRRVYNPILGAPDEGPTGIAEIQCPHDCPQKDIVDRPDYQRVLPPAIAALVHEMLMGVVESGTGTPAAISGVDVAGKTGTTTNYADAWFVGWTPRLTTAVWVGFPSRLVPMATLYNGGPVEGGTFPAIIWHDFMVQALEILQSEQSSSHPGSAANGSLPSGVSVGPSTSSSATSATATAATTSAGPAKGAAPATPQGGGQTGRGGNATGAPPAPTTGAGGGGGAGNGGSAGAGGHQSGSGSGGAGISGGG